MISKCLQMLRASPKPRQSSRDDSQKQSLRFFTELWALLVSKGKTLIIAPKTPFRLRPCGMTFSEHITLDDTHLCLKKWAVRGDFALKTSPKHCFNMRGDVKAHLPIIENN